MKTIVIVIACFVLNFASLSGQGNTGRIIVELENFPNNLGAARSHLFSNKEHFPKKSDSAFAKRIVKIENKRAIFIYDDIPFGEYALTTHHDENNNGKMDRNMIGYPKEGFGLSNNPRIYLTVPSFEECKFVLDKSEIRIKIILKFL